IAGRAWSKTSANLWHGAKLTRREKSVNGALKICFDYAIIRPFSEENRTVESKAKGEDTGTTVGAADTAQSHFIRNIVAEDLKHGKNQGRVHTRFPPEPNGYLHIGHAKSICLNFGLAAEFGGLCNLRFDDTNPSKEDVEYVDSIKEDVRWLGFDWDDREFYASDYFEQLYDWAIVLIEKGKAYVDSQSLEEIRDSRGTLVEPGRNSPYRERPVQES